MRRPWLGLLLLGLACAAQDDGLVTSGAPLEMTASGPFPNAGGAEALDWLEGGGYLDWTAESSIHGSTGPHFGDVRTYVNDILLQSLQGGNAQHPAGSAAVKELYGDGDGVRGWTTMIKLADDSAGGDNWHWYERYEGDDLIDAAGAAACTGCHGSGLDYWRSPFPLQ